VRTRFRVLLLLSLDAPVTPADPSATEPADEEQADGPACPALDEDEVLVAETFFVFGRIVISTS
jgi:hypothetical protein